MAGGWRLARWWQSLAAVILCAAGIAAVATVGAQPSADKWWTGYGNGPDNSRYVASTQITRNNVTQLQAAWTYPFGDAGSRLSATA